MWKNNGIEKTHIFWEGGQVSLSNNQYIPWSNKVNKKKQIQIVTAKRKVTLKTAGDFLFTISNTNVTNECLHATDGSIYFSFATLFQIFEFQLS